MLLRMTCLFVVCNVCSYAMSLTSSSLTRVTCGGSILYVLGDCHCIGCKHNELYIFWKTVSCRHGYCVHSCMWCNTHVWAVFEYAAVTGNTYSLVNYTLIVKYSLYCNDRTPQLKYIITSQFLMIKMSVNCKLGSQTPPRPTLPPTGPQQIISLPHLGARDGAVGWGTALQAGRSQVRFLMVSLEIFIDIFLPATLALGLT